MNLIIRQLKIVHARLEAEIRREVRTPWPNQGRIMRLKKLRLGVKDRLHALLARGVFAA